tara:strand:+ start:1714 stop:3216 length:1503 start_codon:yes stop_codon:yes gene_type:complete
MSYVDEMSCFGASVAVSGRLLYTTDPGDAASITKSTNDRGRVYVFKCNKEGKRGRLMSVISSPTIPDFDDAFGCSIAVDKKFTADICNDRVIIGACRGVSSKGVSGLAYVFETTDGGESYTLVNTLNPDCLPKIVKVDCLDSSDNAINVLPEGSDAQHRMWFGWAVDIYSTGSFGDEYYAMVGAYGSNTSCVWSSGKVYMYKLSDMGNSVLILSNTYDGPKLNEFFGYSVALGCKMSATGESQVYAAIGAFGSNTQGAVYIVDNVGIQFDNDSGNSCDATCLERLGCGCTYGYALDAYCGYLVVGAPYMECTGSAFVYNMDTFSPSAGSECASCMLRLRNQTNIWHFGRAVSIYGNFIVIGTNSPEGGLALVFEKGYSKHALDEFQCLKELNDNYWRLEATLRSYADDEIGFAYSVAVGNCYILVGSPVVQQSNLYTLRVTRKHYCDRATPYLTFDPKYFDAYIPQLCEITNIKYNEYPGSEDKLALVLYHPSLPPKCGC